MPLQARRRIARGSAVGLTVAAMALVVVGATLALQEANADLQGHGMAVIGAGLLASAAAAAVGLSRRAHVPGAIEGSTLRTLSLFQQLLVAAAAVLVLGAVLHRAGVLGFTVQTIVRGQAFIVALVVLAQGLVHLAALRWPAGAGQTRARLAAATVFLAAGALVAVVGLLASRGLPWLEDTASFGPGEAGMILLTSAVLTSMGVHVGQGLPSALRVLKAPDAALHPGGRARHVLLPVVLAFALLVLSLLLFVLFGVGVLGALRQVASQPVVLGVLVAIVVALAASILAAFRLVRHEETRVDLYRPYSDPRARRERVTFGVSAGAAVVLLALAAMAYAGLGLPTGAWIHLAAIGIMVGIGPYGFLVAKEANRIRRLEERFPDFLREIASTHKGGLTLASSVTMAARGDYGPLTPEVKRMADQVAWNVPFTEALERFAGRVQTPLVQRAVNLIVEADRSGGSSTDVLLAAARDAREIKTLENERRSTMTLYTMIIYITFFVFLGVAAVLYAQFVPALVASSEASAAASQGLGAVGGLGGEALRPDQFQMFYFTAALVQGLGDGIVAGMMGTGRAVLGLRHSFAMVLIAYLTFAVFLR